VHDPVGLVAVGRPPLVEDERLPHADEAAPVVHRLVPARGLPEPCHGGPVGPRPRRVLAVLVAEEVPLALLLVPADPAVFFSLFDRSAAATMESLRSIGRQFIRQEHAWTDRELDTCIILELLAC
jgi:hypothetical protein